MPGTVQVSILELTGLPSSTTSSSMSIKVTLGKHTYETQGEKGDFLFPLATLRDNVDVKVHDGEGKEIAHTGVKSRLIAEKGFWDDLFPLEGGGHVHMRLKFSLSEEERNKIRDMRESALKKKQDELLNKSRKDLETAITSSGGKKEMPATAAISHKAHRFNLPQEASNNVLSAKSSTKPDKPSVSIQAKEDTQHHNLKVQSQSEKTPSKVRKTIAAFETSLLLQERMPDVNLTTAKPQSSRETIDACSKEQTSESISALNVDSPIYHIKSVVDPSSKRLQDHPTSAGDERGSVGIHSKSKCVENMEHRVDSEGNSHENVSIKKGKDPLRDVEESKDRLSSKELKRSSNSEQYKISARALLRFSDKHQPSETVTAQQFASVDSFLSETQRAHLKRPQERVRPDISGGRHQCSCQSFHGWIFLEEATCSCIASNNRTVVDLLRDYNVNTKTYPGKLVDEEVASSEDKKHSGISKVPESSPSSGGGTSRGPNGQVMKIVIMVGFGLLVLLTRKRKSR